MDQPRYVDPNSGAAPQPGAVVYDRSEPSQMTEAEQVEAKEVEVGGALDGSFVGSTDDPDPSVGADGVKRTEDERAELKAVETGGTLLGDEGDAAADDADSDDGDDDEAGDSYDPSEYTVDEVNAYLEENPDQRDAVVAAEREGKDRKGITGDE